MLVHSHVDQEPLSIGAHGVFAAGRGGPRWRDGKELPGSARFECGANLYRDGDDPAIGRLVEQFLAIPPPDGLGAAVLGDLPFVFAVRSQLPFESVCPLR